ncbi:hypothetical protein Pmani_020840 [Petrolisthes manimaculis]|uniref:Methyltransferase FkbM domain-containing protein n=1 Tax=Petrolisthes manimaculis TaxID=1843537 RepID=A0AAE1U639_9EUCA|nr:hypothetical protein Pmani_020840 [Petrolisthes manimaculis]
MYQKCVCIATLPSPSTCPSRCAKWGVMVMCVCSFFFSLAFIVHFKHWREVFSNVEESTSVDLVMEGLHASHPKVIHVLRSTSFLHPPSTLPYNLSTDPQYLLSQHGHTWKHIHYFLTKMFQGERGGFFVEAGALDGQQLSNTLWLEQELDWTGLLIEPNPYSFHHLQHKHRKAWTSNSCISANQFTRKSVLVALKLRADYTSYPWYMKGSSYELGVNFGDLTTNLSEHIHYYLNSGDETYVPAYCFPLYSYLLALNVTTIDVLSLDTQGSEIDIVKNIPWEIITVRVLVIELVNSQNTEFVEYMVSRGYILVNNIVDYIFVRHGDPALTRLGKK